MTSGIEARLAGEDGAAADLELGRRLVEWLGSDPEGRRILRALEERPAVGRRALMLRLQRPEFLEPLVAVPPDRRDAPAPLRATTRARGLPRLLPLAAVGLLLGGFVAFMLGVLTLGHADPDFPPLSIFGITLMALASIPFAAGGVAARRSGPALAPAAQSLITIAVLAAAVAVAGLVAGRLG